ncbi:filamentous hemagglutinin N-terminal domain-containing protein [Cardiobacteriaceae bacterium TAE3-ERU3]|nr:filamentous hemagglutinin N-terminal domain-containing protein [Cardiobacteriaceae bacterium TAE3-ERU3]
MNQKCHKVIYSRSLNRMVVVSEISKSRSKCGSRITGNTRSPQYAMTLLPLAWRMLLALGGSLMLVPAANAYIIADENAPKDHQPQILLLGNDTPQIDIQTPSAGGVSLNEYSQFNVDNKGAVLNNSRKNSVSHIAGWVPGNPNLIKGEANVIVNQINSNDPSKLNGYIEVAGQRADVIIANPGGITVNGGGFINSAQTILSTGTAEIHAGQLQGHDIRSGKLRVEGKGLDVSQSDYTTVLAQQIELDGPVYANDKKLDVIAGSNHVDAHGNIQPHNTGSGGNYSALDSSKLGGMYANSIRLISTEKGIGINHAGHIAASTLTLDTDGTLHNSGTIEGNNQTITLQGLDNSGALTATGNQSIATHQLTNSGTLGAGQIQHIDTRSVDNSGNIQAGSLQLTTQQLQNKGSISQTGNGLFNMTSEGLDNSGHIGKPQRGSSTASSDTTTGVDQQANENGWLQVGSVAHNSGQITANGSMSLSSNSNLVNSGSLTPDKLTFNGQALRNSGTISTKQAHLNGTQLDNSGNLGSLQFKKLHFTEIDNSGNIYGSSSYTVESETLQNSGAINSSSGLHIDATSSINNSGVLSANNTLGINSPTLDNTEQGQISGGSLNLTGTTLDNKGVIAQTNSGALNIETPVLHNSGNVGVAAGTAAAGSTGSAASTGTTTASVPVSIGSGSTGRIQYGQIDNGGSIVAAGPTNLTVTDDLSNTGSMSLNQFNYQAETLTNRGFLHANEATITSSALDNRGGTLSAGRFVPLKFTRSFDNTNGRIQSQQDLDLTVGILNHQGVDSLIASQSDLNLHATSISNEGKLYSGKHFTLDTRSIENSGLIQAGKELSATLESIDNSGDIRAETLHIDVNNLENTGNIAQTGTGDFAISTHDLYNHKDAVLGKPLDPASTAGGTTGTPPAATPQSGSAGNLTVHGNLDNKGRLTANGNSSLDVSGQFKNLGSIGLHELTMSRAHLNNEGTIYADIADLSGQTLHNSGKLQADLFKRFDYQNLIDNQGVIAGQQNFVINTARLNNTVKGLIHGDNDLEVDARMIDNLGTIHASHDLHLTSGNTTLDNQGQLGAGNALDLDSRNIENHKGAILTGKAVTLNNQSLNNAGNIQGATLALTNERTTNQGNILFTGNVTLDSSTFNNPGHIAAGGQLDATLKNANNSGTIDAKVMDLTATTLTNEGIINAQKSLDITAERTVNKTGASIQSRTGVLNVDSKTLENQGAMFARTWNGQGDTLRNHGDIAATETLSSAYKTLRNQGNIVGNQLQLEADQIDNSGHIRQTGTATLALNSTRLDNLDQALIGKVAATTSATSTGTSGSATAGVDGHITAANIVNRGQGSINSAGELTVNTAQTLNNDATISAEKLNFNGKTLTNSGTINVTQAAIDGERINNHAILYAGQFSNLTLTQLDNQGTLGSEQALDVNATTLHNLGTNAKLFSANALTVNSETLNNTGTVQGKSLTLNNRQTTRNSGTLQAVDDAAVNTTTLNNNHGNIYSGKNLAITATMTSNSGNLEAKAKLVLDSDNLANSGNIHATDSNIHIADLLDNQAGGTITAEHTQQIESANLDNTGKIAATDKVELSTGKLDNRGELISQDLGITAASLQNSGSITQTGNADLTLHTAELINKNGGAILSGGSRTTATTPTPGTAGSTATVGTHTLDITDRITNSGSISTGGNIELDVSQHIDNAGKLRMDALNITPALKWTLHDSSDIAVNSAKFSLPETVLNGHLSTKTLDVDSQRFTNLGTLSYNHADWHNVTDWTNSGKLSTTEDLVFDHIAFANTIGASIKTSGKFIFSGDVLNNAGSLLAGGDQTITTPELNNSGIIATNATQHWNIATLNNQSGGEIDAATLDWQLTNLNNHGAIFHTGGGALRIEAKDLVNGEAILGHSSVTLPNQAASLNPATPSTPATGTTPATPINSLIHVAETLTNQGQSGQKAAIVSNQDVSLDLGHTLTNRHGGQIQLQQLDHHGKSLTTEHGSTIDADHLNLDIDHLNNAGELLTSNDLTLHNLSTFTNSGTIGTLAALNIDHNGTLQNSGAIKAAQLDLNTTTLANLSGGNIQSAGEANITTQNGLKNRGKIAAQQLNLKIPSLDNSGHIFAHNNYTQSLTGYINNSGTLSGGNTLSFNHAPLSNRGNIYAYDLSITTPQFSNSGTISAQHNLYIKRPGSWQVSGNITAGNQLHFDIGGALYNTSTFGGVNETRIDASSISNSGRILSERHINLHAGSLSNTGLINSSGTTELDINGTLDNSGSGRIYGDRVQINAYNLNNTARSWAAPVIAGRYSVQIEANNVRNTAPYMGNNAVGALIKSDGSMSISGRWGRASQILNRGSTIESRGSMSLAANSIRNENVYIRTEMQQKSSKQKLTYQKIRENGRVPYGEIYDSEEHDIYIQKGGDQELVIDGVPGIEDFVIYDYQETIFEDRAVETQPGHITVGGNLHVDSASAVNDKSKILVAGTINNGGKDIHNEDLKGSRKTLVDGQFVDKVVKACGFLGGDHCNRWGKWQPYQFEKDESDVTIPLTQTEEHAVVSYSGQRAASSGISASGRSGSVDAGFKTLNKVDVSLPQNSLYKVDPNDPLALVHIDPDYIGGVIADFKPGITPEQRNREHDSGNIGTDATAVANGNQANLQKVDDAATPKTTAERLDAISVDIGSRKDNLLADLDNRFNQQVNPDSAYQSGVTFGVDQAKIDLAAPYVPALLKDNPALTESMHKRIGDMYTEMQLIQDQVGDLTGRKIFNDGTAVEEYKALLDSGAHFAQQFNLKPGVELTAEQMASLTDDLVWYVNRDVTLPDGSVQTVSVPKVYLRPQKGDIDGRYTYISADHIIDDSKTGHLKNDAIYNGRKSIQINNAGVTNRGTISAGRLYSNNSATFDNTGGQVTARHVLDINAGNIVGQSTTRNDKYQIGIGEHSTTTIDRQSSFILDNGGEGEAGYLNLHAKNTNTQNGSAIINRNKDSATFVSGDKGVILGTVSTEETHNHDADSRHYNHESTRTDNGTVIQGQGNVTVSSIAGKVDATAAQIDSANGKTTVYGAKGVDIKNGWRDDGLAYATTNIRKKLFNTTRTADQHDEQSHQAIASNVTGKTVDIIAGDIQQDGTVTGNADITLTGSNVVSDHGTLLKAGHDITLNSAENTYSIDHQQQSTKSGLMGAGFGIFYGTRNQNNDTTQKGTVYSAGMVGALDGNVIINAGKHYQNNGNLVHAGRGDEQLTREQWEALSTEDKLRAGNVFIVGQSGEETGLINTHHQESHLRSKQEGLTLSIGGQVVSGIQSVKSNLDRLDSGNSRVAAMSAANSAWSAYNTYQAVQGGSDGDTINIRLTYGSSQSSSDQVQNSQGIQAAQTTAAGTVNYLIRGQGEESTLNIIGSDSGGRFGTNFDVEGKKHFKALELNHDASSRNKSSGADAGIGASYSRQSNSASFGGTGSFHYGKGYSEEQTTTYRNTHIGSAEGLLNLGDGKTTLEGAQGFGYRIIGNTKDLTIISLQNSGRSKAEQFNVSATATYGYGGGSASGDISYQTAKGSMQSISADSGQRDALGGANANSSKAGQLGAHIADDDQRANINQALHSGQSGLFAGDGGYGINNTGTTTLDGGIITSSAVAEAEGRNSFITDRLLLKDLDNHSKLEAKGISLGGSVVTGGGFGKSAGVGKEGHDERGTTYASINTANITIRDEAGQQQLSGQSVAETIARANRNITTETAKANSGATGQSIATEGAMAAVGEEMEVTREFAPHAAQSVAYVSDKLAHSEEYNKARLAALAAESILAKPDISPAKRESARNDLSNAQAIMNQYQGAQDLWGEGGIARAGLHGISGVIVGGDVAGGIGAAASSLTAPTITKLKEGRGVIGGTLIDFGAGGLIGALSGDYTGAVTGANTDWYNRQLHRAEIDRINETADEYARENGISRDQAVKELIFTAAMQVDKKNNELLSGELSNEEYRRAQQWLGTHGQGSIIFNSDGSASAQTYFSATEEQWKNSFTNLSHISTGSPINFMDMVDNKAASIISNAAWDSSGRYGGGKTSAKNIIAQYGYEEENLRQLGQDAKALIPLLNKETDRNLAALHALRQSNPDISEEALQNSKPYKRLQELHSSIKATANVLNDKDFVTPLFKDDPDFQRGKDIADMTLLKAAIGLSSNRSAGNAVKAGNIRVKAQPDARPDGSGMIAQRGQFTLFEDGRVVNSNGTKYAFAGYDGDKNIVYAYESSKSSYVRINSDGGLDRLTSSEVPAKFRTSSFTYGNANPQKPQKQRPNYDWIDEHRNSNAVPGFIGEKAHSENTYFVNEVQWQAPHNGTSLEYKVYQQNINLDARPRLSDGDLSTNAELMHAGKAPFVLKNGKYEQVQLHHSRQNGQGALFELTESTHNAKKGTGREALHPYGNSVHPEYPVNRELFDKDRKQYWKDRLNQLKGGK